MDALVISKMNEDDDDEENEEVTLLKKREEAERKARRGELDPTHEYTFTILAQVCKILNLVCSQAVESKSRHVK